MSGAVHMARYCLVPKRARSAGDLISEVVDLVVEIHACPICGAAPGTACDFGRTTRVE